METLKGLTANVFKSRHKSGNIINCTNNGLSSKVEEITIIGDEVPEIFVATEEAPAFKVVTRILSGEPYKHLEPIERPTGTGWMYGGNIAYCSDSRFPNKYPLKIHDRQEF